MTDYPRRPQPHIIGEEAVRIFRNSCDPQWIVSTSEPDYGIDLKIELTSGGQVTGQECYVQVKGTTKIRIPGYASKLGPIVTVKRSTLNYWLAKLNPIVVVLVDVNTKEIWYGWVDGGSISDLPKDFPKTGGLVLRHRDSEVPLRETLPLYLEAHYKRLQIEIGALDRQLLTKLLFHVERLHQECVTEYLFLQFFPKDISDEHLQERHHDFLQQFTVNDAFAQVVWHTYAQKTVRKTPKVVEVLTNRFTALEQLRDTFIRRSVATEEDAAKFRKADLTPEAKLLLLNPNWAVHYHEFDITGLLANLLPTMSLLTEIKNLIFQLLVMGDLRQSAEES